MKIDIHNYEEFMLSFVDNELNAEEIKALTLFLEQHPEQQAELKLLQATRLPAGEKVIFPDKDSLYRKEEVHAQRVYFLRRHPWLSIAAAACLLLFVTLVVHPWNKQTVHQETAVNALPAQHNKLIIPAPADTSSWAAIHKEQKETLAFRQSGKKNIVHPVTKTKESMALAGTQSADKLKPALPDTVLHANEHNSLALQENNIPAPLPLENIAPSVSAKPANIHKDNAPKNDAVLMASNRSGENKDFVQKVDEWRKKPSEVLESIHHNGIKIGKITIAFNN